MKQFIMKVGESIYFDDMAPELKEAIRAIDVQWPESQMSGTKVVGGHKLILIMANASREDLENAIKAFKLDWQVVADEDSVIDQDLLLPFIEGAPRWDEETEDFEYEPVTDLTGKLQTWSGKQWRYN